MTDPTDKVTTEQMLEFLDYIVGRSDAWAIGDTVPTTIGEMVAEGPSEFVPPPMTKPDGDTMWKAIRARLTDYDALKKHLDISLEAERVAQAEAERLKDEWDKRRVEYMDAIGVMRTARLKAEAALAEAGPLIEAVMKGPIHDGGPGIMALLEAADAYRAAREKKEGKCKT